jgi:hypothetical protein
VSVGIAAFLLVLLVLVALALASFFRHTLAALMVLVAIPSWLVLQTFMGGSYAVFTLALLAAFAAVIHTIGDTLRLMRTAKRADRRAPAALAQRRAPTRPSERSRRAA